MRKGKLFQLKRNEWERIKKCGGGPLQMLGNAIVLENEVNTMNENNLGGRIKGLLKKKRIDTERAC